MATKSPIKQSKFIFSWQPAGTAGVSQGRHWNAAAEDWRGPMDRWQPINTAPRDGRTILAYLPANAGLPTRQDVVAICWATGWTTAYSGARLDIEPTYWMPLPRPPNTVEPHASKDDQQQAGIQSGPI